MTEENSSQTSNSPLHPITQKLSIALFLISGLAVILSIFLAGYKFWQRQSLTSQQKSELSEEQVSIADFTDSKLKIAFLDPQEKGALLISDLAQRTVKKIALSKSKIFNATITSDGRQVAFSDEEGLFLLDLTNDTKKLLKRHLRDSKNPVEDEVYNPVSWSPNQKWILLKVDSWESSTPALINKDGTNYRRIKNTKGNDVGCISGYDWAPDGNNLVITGSSIGSPCNREESAGLNVLNISSEGDLMLRKIDLLRVQFKEESLVAVYDPSYSSDGQKIIFIQAVLSDQPDLSKDFMSNLVNKLFVIDPTNNHLSELPLKNEKYLRTPKWVGRDKAVYASSWGGIIYEVDLNNSSLRKIYELSNMNFEILSVSPDGKLAIINETLKDPWAAFSGLRLVKLTDGGAMNFVHADPYFVLNAFAGWIDE